VGPDTPADHDYQGGFAAALMLKDLRLALDAASGANVDTPMGARAAELYGSFVAEGGASTDFSGIIRMLAKDS
jgi:3-hydroxyisobutyrate dehydrogenase